MPHHDDDARTNPDRPTHRRESREFHGLDADRMRALNLQVRHPDHDARPNPETLNFPTGSREELEMREPERFDGLS